MAHVHGQRTVMTCPWCLRLAEKDDACNWVTCGLTDTGFQVHHGCGMQWCFACGGKLCGQLYDSDTGIQRTGVATSHSADCCPFPGYCPGGHNSHKSVVPLELVRLRPDSHADAIAEDHIIVSVLTEPE